MSSSPVDVSVVIPSFNRTELAVETVESVLAQTRPVNEIVVVANGSDDHAAFWTQRFRDRIRVVREQPVGKQVARTTGFREARSTWVATLDDDDLYLPDFIASVEPAILDGRADLISTDHRKFRSDRADKRTNFEAAPPRYWDGLPRDPGSDWTLVEHFPLDRLLKRVPFYPSTCVVRRDFALRIGGYDPRMKGIMSEDLEFLIRALTHGSVAIVWKPMVRYRMHEGNDTASVVGREIGRWRIFEFAREQHAGLPKYFVEALDRDLPRRRRRIYALAHQLKDEGLIQEVSRKLGPDQWTVGMRLRRLMRTIHDR